MAAQSRKKKNEEATESEGEEDASQSDEASSEDSAEGRASSEATAFRRKPLDPSKDYNPDGTEKFTVKTRLMLKLQEIDTEGECSDEVVDNSFGE